MDLIQEVSLLIAQLTDEIQELELKREKERFPAHADYLDGQLEATEEIKERLEKIYKE